MHESAAERITSMSCRRWHGGDQVVIKWCLSGSCDGDVEILLSICKGAPRLTGQKRQPKCFSSEKRRASCRVQKPIPPQRLLTNVDVYVEVACRGVV
jgi:hypothetical protein